MSAVSVFLAESDNVAVLPSWDTEVKSTDDNPGFTVATT
jgi:hypothetical protein